MKNLFYAQNRRKLAAISGGSALFLQLCLQSSVALAQTEAPPILPSHNQNAIEIIDDELMAKMLETMRTAAMTYPTVLAGQKAISAVNNNAAAAIFNQVVVGAQVGGITGEKDERNTALYSANGPLSANGISNSVSVSLTLSLASFLQSKGFMLTAEMQKSALKALQMQNATNAAQAFMGVVTNRFREYFLVNYEEQLRQIERMVSDINKTRPDFHGPVDLSTKISKIADKKYSAVTASSDAGEQLIQYTNDKVGTALALDLKNATEKTFRDLMQAEDGPYLAWNKIEDTFVIPDSEQAALQQSVNSPVIIQSEISQKIAKNNWFISVAGLGPTLFATFSRQHIDNFIYPDGSKETEKYNLGDTWTAGVKFNISGGVLNTISANKLLEDSSRLTGEAVKRSLRESITSSYHLLTNLKLQMHENQSTLGRFLPKLVAQASEANIQPLALQGIISAYDDIDISTASFMSQIDSVLTARLQILSQTGALLHVIGIDDPAPTPATAGNQVDDQTQN